MQTTIRAYKLTELYKMDGAGKSYRSFQRRKWEYVEVLVQVGKRTQKRYLDRSDSLFMKAVKNLVP